MTSDDGEDTVASALESFDVNAAAIPIEFHAAVHESKNGVIAPETNVSARKEFGAPLTQDDVAGDHGFSAKLFHT